MIARSAEDGQIPDWRRELAEAVTDPALLLDLLDLPRTLLPSARAAAARFGLRAPRGFLARIARGDPDDPLLRQVLPLGAELEEAPGFSDDPVGDLEAAREGGVLRKYQGRALVIASAACAVNCRYCFRRAFPYAEHLGARNAWRDALEQLRRDPEITEAILSGGDPLTLDDTRLGDLIDGLDAIAHIRRLRIHTRVPVVIPARITPMLCRMLSASRLSVTVVLHFNHPQELSPDVATALARLRPSATLLNQSVLLRGVNDRAETLIRLSEGLFDTGVLPYYIHRLDPVRGAAHFEVDEETARAIIAELRRRLPGYLVPRLVREEKGAPSKTPIM